MTFQREEFTEAFKAEMNQVIVAHWDEVALSKDKMPLNVNWADYFDRAAKGALVVITAREEGKLAGYWVLFLGENPHYQGVLLAITDIYRILPEYRKGLTGVRMFAEGEKILKDIGVKKIVTATKLHADCGSVWEKLGWIPVERIYQKWIGE